MQNIILKIISIYQKTISPDHGIAGGGSFTGCRYHPSCSEYCKQAIIKKGSLKGLTAGAWRILRCNPLSKGGVDLP